MKQETQHTPGPWEVFPIHWDGGINSINIDGHNTAWIDSPRGELARVHPNGHRIDSLVYADAYLIAAAPDLLEALKAVSKLDYLQEHNALAAQVKAAIARAEGKA